MPSASHYSFDVYSGKPHHRGAVGFFESRKKDCCPGFGILIRPMERNGNHASCSREKSGKWGTWDRNKLTQGIDLQ